MVKEQVNPRKKKLDAIATKIAMFMMNETYTDEQDAQRALMEAINQLDKASVILVNSDREAIKNET